jgi:non-specific serine/threonine protein kinase/serine/threonine-protein kinase
VNVTRNNSERFAEIVELALERDPSERAQFLAKACCDDLDLHKDVEALLGFEEKATDFIEKPAYEMAAKIIVDQGGELKAGEQLGEYKVLSLIGEGGMGEVYLAEDTTLGRKVAIKLLKFGLGTTNIIRRFQQEERILAGLSHANIAQLHGGAVTRAGLPYFVMEYVDGARLDDYCRDRQLSISQCLALFRKICAAVSYAHQNLVIHRDIKPANIRITSDGEPKLLDFGIAKLLDPTAPIVGRATMTFAAVMTPEYASPEQVRGENMTTASDVYSLGVVLYELLTGQRPYRIKTRNPNEIARAITGQEPVPPSVAVARSASSNSQSEIGNPKLLRGDLDNIILKALRKEPSRRYGSVAQFSDDIRRYLEGRPVTARKDTFNYRAVKFIKRNKVAVAAAGLILLSLVGGIFATAFEARRAELQRARAENRFNDVRRLAHSLMFEIDDSVKDLQGSTPTRRLIVSRALEYLDGLAGEAADNPTLQRELATAYEKIGDIQGNPYYANLGDADGALASHRKALAIREKLKNPGDTLDARMELGRSYRALGDILEQKGDVASTMENYRRSKATFEELAASKPQEPSVQDELARAHETLGDGLSRSSESTSERLKSYQTALSIRETLLGQKPSDPKLRRSVAVTLLKIGAADDPKKTGAVESIKRGIAVLEKLSAESPDNERARRDVGFGYYQLGNTLMVAGDYPAALESRQKAFAIRQEIAAQDPKNAQALFDLADAHGDLSEALTATGASIEALDQARQALSILQQLSAADPTNAVYLRNIGLCYETSAQALSHLAADETRSKTQRIKDWNAARSWFGKALNLFSELSNHGTLMPADSGQAAKFTAKIAECDTAIAQLTK